MHSDRVFAESLIVECALDISGISVWRDAELDSRGGVHDRNHVRPGCTDL